MKKKCKEQQLSNKQMVKNTEFGMRSGTKPNKKRILSIALIIGLLLVALGVAGYIYFDGFSIGKYSKASGSKEAEVNIQDSAEVSPEDKEETLEDQRNQYYGSDYFVGKVENLNQAEDIVSVFAVPLGDDVKMSGDIEWESGGMHFYKLKERYMNLDVYGRSMTVVTDAGNNVIGVSSNCIPLDGLSTEESITKFDAEKVAEKYASEKAGCDNEYVDIYDTDEIVYSIECQPYICWKVNVHMQRGANVGETTLLIDANNGYVKELLHDDLILDDRQINAEGQKGAKYDINITNYGEADFLEDRERKIYIHSLKNHQKYDSIEAINDRKEWPRGNKDLADTSNRSGVDALGNLTNTYDFYKNVLGWEGYDNKKSELNVYVEADCNEVNAFWSGGEYNSISFIGYNYNYRQGIDLFGSQWSCQLDIVAHEFTHGVTEYTSGLYYGSWDNTYGTSSGAINESLSDIMGEIVEKYVTGRCDWKNGRSRDFKIEREYNEGGEVHKNARHINHIAYLIGNGQEDVDGYSKEDTMFFDGGADERGDLEAYAKFWFGVQSSLPATASLDQLATVAANVGRAMRDAKEITEAQYQGILKAFSRYGHDIDRVIYPEQGNGEVASCVVLCVDISGSMNDLVSDGISTDDVTKLDIAKQSAGTLIDQIEKISDRYRDEFLLSVVSFSNEANIKAVPSVDMSYERTSVESLTANGGTNIGDGLKGALDMIGSFNGGKSIILLSDGDDTAGNSEEDLINIAQEAATEGIAIYTIGFGNKDSFNEELLINIAEATGGQYRWASPDSAISLVANLLHAQADSLGEVLNEEEGELSQGETSSKRQFEVSNDTGDLSALLYWPGSKMETVLTDPDGEQVTNNYEGADIDDTTIPAEIVVKDPKPGEWEVSVYAKETSQKNEPYYSLISYRQFDRVSTTSLKPAMHIIAVFLPVGVVLSLISVILLLFYTRLQKSVLPKTNNRDYNIGKS